MTFLNPLLLIGLAAAAIPLIIHLFNFRRPRRVDFSSLAFLHELRKSTMQRVRIKQWLLLALRTLAIVFLVMAFARPTVTGDLAGRLGGGGRTSIAIVFDNSRSMSLRDGAGSYIEQARTVAGALVDRMESGDEAFIVPTVLPGETAAPFQNRAGARRSILSIEPGDGEMSIVESVARASGLLATSANPNREIYVISDLQASTFGDSLGTELAEGVSIFLISIGTREHDNIAVTGVEVLSRILSTGQAVRMEATLQNHGDRPLNDVVVSLYLDGQRVSRATTGIGPDETTTVPITVTPRSAGWLGGQVEIEDTDYHDDDVRRFTLFIPEERSILLVAGEGASTRYVELALSGAVAGSEIRFSVERIPETGLARAVLGAYDTVVLTGVRDLTSGERAALENYVREGGGLLLFPGADLSVPDYNALLAELGAGTVERITDPVTEGAAVAGFSTVDVRHPLFEGMFQSPGPGETPRLEQPEIMRMMLYNPGEGSEQTLIRLTDDRSFLQEIRHERGSVILYAIAPDDDWSDFPVRGLFVPLLYRSIYYLSAGGSVMGERFRAGEAAQLRLTGVASDAEITIVSENGDSYVPELRRTPGGVLALIGPGYLGTGIYAVRAGEEMLQKFVVHAASEESDLAVLDPENARDRLAEETSLPVRIVDASGADAGLIEARLSSARTGVELWNVFMVLALFTLLAEMIVERKWRPEAA